MGDLKGHGRRGSEGRSPVAKQWFCAFGSVVKRDVNFCTSVVLDFLRKLIEQHPAPPPMETPKPEERPPTTTDLVQTGKKNRKRKEKNGTLLLRRGDGGSRRTSRY